MQFLSGQPTRRVSLERIQQILQEHVERITDVNDVTSEDYKVFMTAIFHASINNASDVDGIPNGFLNICEALRVILNLPHTRMKYELRKASKLVGLLDAAHSTTMVGIVCTVYMSQISTAVADPSILQIFVDAIKTQSNLLLIALMLTHSPKVVHRLNETLTELKNNACKDRTHYWEALMRLYAANRTLGDALYGASGIYIALNYFYFKYNLRLLFGLGLSKEIPNTEKVLLDGKTKLIQDYLALNADHLGIENMVIQPWTLELLATILTAFIDSLIENNTFSFDGLIAASTVIFRAIGGNGTGWKIFIQSYYFRFHFI